MEIYQHLSHYYVPALIFKGGERLRILPGFILHPTGISGIECLKSISHYNKNKLLANWHMGVVQPTGSLITFYIVMLI